MGIEFKANRSEFSKLNALLNEEALKPMARRITEKANEESSFGLYDTWEGDYVSRVYAMRANKQSERGRRLLRLMGQEREM